MLITLARTLFLYTLVMVTMRLMGKRQIAQLEPFELVIAIMIAELAVIPMQDRDIPLINGVIAIITLLFVQVSFSVLSLKFLWFRSVLDGRYSVIIANGVIQEAEMRKARYNGRLWNSCASIPCSTGGCGFGFGNQWRSQRCSNPSQTRNPKGSAARPGMKDFPGLDRRQGHAWRTGTPSSAGGSQAGLECPEKSNCHTIPQDGSLCS